MIDFYSYAKTIKFSRIVVIILFFAIIFSAISVDMTYATANGQVGYFGTIHVEGYGDPAITVLPQPEIDKNGDPTGNAIPDYIGSTGALVDFLYLNNTSTDNHKKTGAAYIVCTMLGHSNFVGCRNAGYIDEYRSVIAWGELRLRLANPNIKILWDENMDFINFENTMYDPDEIDIFHYTKTEKTTRHTIVISNTEGTIDYYRLFRLCANPIGSLGGLPIPEIPKQWNLRATSTNNTLGTNTPGESKPGDTIVWNHNLYNDGPDATTMEITSNLRTTGFSSANGGGVSPSGTVKDAIVRTLAGDYSTHKVVQADVGNNLCERVNFDPSNSIGGRDGQGNDSCVGVPYKFNLTASTTIHDDNINPGSSISFHYKLTNDGPTKTSREVGFATLMLRIPSAKKPELGQLAGVAEITGTRKEYKTAVELTGKDDGSSVILKDDISDTVHKITQADVGNWICGYMVATPKSSAVTDDSNNDDSYVKSYECKYIPYSYTLVPTVAVDHTGTMRDGKMIIVVEDGTDFKVTANIENTGGTISEPATWTFKEEITNPNSNNVSSESKVIFKEKHVTEVKNLTITAKGNPGKQYCYILSVKPHSNIDSSEISSVQSCVVIGKKPKVQIWGGDLLAGNNVTSSTSIKAGAMFGSWVEYGIFAAGLIKGSASGSAFAGNGLTPISTPISPCGYSILSFVNAGASTCLSTSIIGNYKASWPITDIAASFPGSGEAISGTFVPSSKGVGVHIYSASDLNIDTSNLAPQTTIIIKASGTVTIIGNQTYSNGSYTKISDLPQLVVLANKIVINGNVENVDAWLVAKDGVIDTCNQAGNTINKCGLKLTINGPVIAKKLNLYRTAGSGTGAASGDPAEVFNLRADAYLWAISRAASDSKIQTVYTTELPPRF